MATTKGESLLYQSNLIVLIVAAVLTALPPLSEPLRLPVSPSKPYTGFNEFYDFYLREHSNIVCRRLHFAGTSLVIVLALKDVMAMLPAIVLAQAVGIHMCAALRFMDRGFLEFGVVLLVLLFVGRALGGRPLRLILVGYIFAWIGHVAYEGNKPATFIYPTFSLCGDFFMWFQMLTGKVVGLPFVPQ